MSILTAADIADLAGLAAEAQPDHSLILARSDGAGGYTTIPAQDVQVMYPARQARAAVGAGAVETLADVTFLRESPFNVQVGDRFELNGQRAGKIRRVTIDPVLGLIMADGTFDVGTVL